MKKRVHSIPIIFILVLILFFTAKQLIADFYYRKAHHDRQELNKTIGYLEKSFALDDKNALFHFYLGRVYLIKALARAQKRNEKNNWLRKSIDEFHRATELEPSHSDYHFHLGISYGALGYPPPFYWEVIQNAFKRAAMLNPTDFRHLYSIGNYYLNEYKKLRKKSLKIEGMGSTDRKNYEELLKENYQFYFKKLLNVNEEYLTKILDKCFSVTQEYTDLNAFRRNTARSHLILAQFLNSKGMWAEAKNHYMIAINLEPLNPIYYAKFANAFSSRRDFRNAITWWQKQKMLNPQDERIYLFLSYGFMRLNRFDDALRELHELIKLNPENINYQIKLIRTLINADKVDEAIKEYHNILEKNPNFSKEMYDSVLYFQKKGNYKYAVKLLNNALVSTLNR